MKANVSLPLFESTEMWDQVKHRSLFGIWSEISESKPEIEVYIVLNRASYSRLENEVEIENSTFGYTVMNDGGGADTFRLGGSFVNGEPVLHENFSLERREKMDVTVSNVRLSYLVKKGNLWLISLQSRKAQPTPLFATLAPINWCCSRFL